MGAQTLHALEIIRVISGWVIEVHVALRHVVKFASCVFIFAEERWHDKSAESAACGSVHIGATVHNNTNAVIGKHA